MNIKIIQAFVVIFITILILPSCSKKNDDKKINEQPLSIYSNMKFGWGQGRVNNPGYLSLKNGIPKTVMSVNPSDRSAQETIDVVFPGDWGHSGGGLFITAPSAAGTGGAHYEYCKDWQRKRGTRFAAISGYDIAKFEKVTTVAHLVALEKENAKYYYDFIGLPDEGTTFVIRTEDGDIALAFIHAINGTYGSQNANVTISLKTILKKNTD